MSRSACGWEAFFSDGAAEGVTTEATFDECRRNGTGDNAPSESVTEAGIVYGVGAESKVSERLSLRVEYLGFGNLHEVGISGSYAPA